MGEKILVTNSGGQGSRLASSSNSGTSDLDDISRAAAPRVASKSSNRKSTLPSSRAVGMPITNPPPWQHSCAHRAGGAASRSQLAGNPAQAESPASAQRWLDRTTNARTREPEQ